MGVRAALDGRIILLFCLLLHYVNAEDGGRRTRGGYLRRWRWRRSRRCDYGEELFRMWWRWRSRRCDYGGRARTQTCLVFWYLGGPQCCLCIPRPFDRSHRPQMWRQLRGPLETAVILPLPPIRASHSILVPCDGAVAREHLRHARAQQPGERGLHCDGYRGLRRGGRSAIAAERRRSGASALLSASSLNDNSSGGRQPVLWVARSISPTAPLYGS